MALDGEVLSSFCLLDITNRLISYLFPLAPSLINLHVQPLIHNVHVTGPYMIVYSKSVRRTYWPKRGLVFSSNCHVHCAINQLFSLWRDLPVHFLASSDHLPTFSPFQWQINRDINDISILKTYQHLRYLELSKNNLKDVTALNALSDLLSIKCEFNKLKSAALIERPYLQVRFRLEYSIVLSYWASEI